MLKLMLFLIFACYMAVVSFIIAEMFDILFSRGKEKKEFDELKNLESVLLSRGFELKGGQFNTYIKKLGNLEIRIERFLPNIRITIKGNEQVWFSFPEENLHTFLTYPDKILQERLNLFSQYMLSCLKTRLPELERNGPNYICYTYEQGKIKSNSLY